MKNYYLVRDKEENAWKLKKEYAQRSIVKICMLAKCGYYFQIFTASRFPRKLLSNPLRLLSLSAHQ